MTHAHALRRLDRLLRESTVVPCERDDRFVIFSDLHLGDGSSRDEFVHNTALFRTVLSEHYLQRRFKLVLNGDIEDLYKFPLRAVMEHCGDLYRLFDAFLRTTALYKIVGNHDADLAARNASFQRLPLYPGAAAAVRGAGYPGPARPPGRISAGPVQSDLRVLHALRRAARNPQRQRGV